MIVYKVVSGFDFRIGEGWSTVLSLLNRYRLRYKIGEVTVPNIGYIFAFAGPRDAVAFINYTRLPNLVILVCDAVVNTEATAQNLVSLFTHPDEIWSFWRDREHHRQQHTVNAPPGTIFCTEVTPLRVLAQGDLT